MRIESALAELQAKPQIALEIDGVAAILDLVADGAGYAILSRNAVKHSIRPSAFSTRPIGTPALSIELTTAVSALRPTTLTQQATLQLLREITQQHLGGN
jgi:LysR family nitrogen assimilation transcriptional regulator